MNLRPVLAVGAVITHGGSLLLVQRGQPPGRGHWSLPGGHLEPGERLVEAVEREVAEETGLSVRCGPLLELVERISDDHHFVIADFHAELIGSADARPGDDARAVAWVPRHDVRSWSLVDGLAAFLSRHGFAD